MCATFSECSFLFQKTICLFSAVQVCQISDVIINTTTTEFYVVNNTPGEWQTMPARFANELEKIAVSGSS